MKDKPRPCTLVIDENFCKGCQICISFCPTKVLDVGVKVNARGYYVPVIKTIENCTCCGICELFCPDFAIAIDRSKEQ